MRHVVAIRVGRRLIDLWTQYSIDIDMLTPADAFSLTLAPVSKEVWDTVAPDSAVSVLVDGVQVLDGFIDSRTRIGGRRQSTISVEGRDRTGRLVDESMPLTSFSRLSMVGLAKKVASPWITDVVLSNERNRDLVRGRRSGKAAKGSEPLIENAAQAPKKVDAGETRWDVLRQFLEPAGVLAWSTADGKELVIGKPNYDQEVQYRFFCAAPGSSRADEANVEDWEIQDSVKDRYSKVTVVGASRGDSANYSSNVTRHSASVLDGPNADGTGGDFIHPKELIVASGDVKDRAGAKKRAARELALRTANANFITIEVEGHAQRRTRTDAPALYAVDTMCHFEDEVIGRRGKYLVVAVRFLSSRDSQTTELTLVPQGTVLSL